MPRIRPEDHQEAIDHDDGKPDQQDELLVVRPRDEGRDHHALQGIADDEEQQRHRHQRQDRRQAEKMKQDPRDIHGEHGEFAMGEIHHAHHAEDDREPERHQAIDQACQHALDQHF